MPAPHAYSRSLTLGQLNMISSAEAHRNISMLEPLQPVDVPLGEALGLVYAESVYAVSNCPTVDSSLKDGFAVVFSDIADASPSNPVTLVVTGSLAAGDDKARFHVTSRTAVRIMTGAAVPHGATSVPVSEFAQFVEGLVTIKADSRVGLNILRKGSDIVQQQMVLAKGDMLGPAHLDLLAAAGLKDVICYPLPKVAIAATGSELVWAGAPLTEGKVAASNMVIAAAELQALGIMASTVLLHDNLDYLDDHFRQIVPQVDLPITCGCVLDGKRTLLSRRWSR